MRPTLPAAAAVLLALMQQTQAAGLSKTYSYFSIGGSTIEEIEKELGRRGPLGRATGLRHPGATNLRFKTALGFAQDGKSCRIASAKVSVNAKVTLPSWRRPKKAEASTRLIWDTLASDIKRHEESHISIARTAASNMEAELRKLRSFSDCGAASAKAQEVSARLLARHDADQARFDRIEARNFEARLMRLLQNRLERMRSGG